MSDETQKPDESTPQPFAPPPAQKQGMKWWVIALIVVAVLCCCCVVTGVVLYTFGDQIFGTDFLEEFNRTLFTLVA